MSGNLRPCVAACGFGIALCACHVAPDTVASFCTGHVGSDAGTDAGLSQGLLVYYSCDQTGGATLEDLSGNGNDATLVTGTGGTGGYSFATGKVGNALVLTAASDGYAVLPTGILADACEATIATWVNVKSGAVYQRVWDFGWNTTVYMYLTPSDAIKMPRFGISIAGNYTNEFGIDGQTALPLDEWHHLAVVLAPSDVVLYMDGQVAGTNPAIPLRPLDLGSTPNNYIGRSQFSVDAYLDGDIDDFRIYNRALSADEIQELVNGS
ncbi:MAG: LamG domain-containing protein [Polyangia bacterium]|jgi:hypothetical protein